MPTLRPPSVEPKARLFRGFAEPSRLRILEVLRVGSKTVGEICAATGLTQSNVSNHLACLLGCRLVEREPRGRFALYRLSDERIDAFLALADEIAAGRDAGAACCPVCGSTSR